MPTLDDVIARGLDVRAWCFRCARGGERFADVLRDEFARKGYSLDLGEAARRFRCSECGRSDEVSLFPCGPLPVGNTTMAQLVGTMFRAMRGRAKRAKRKRFERGE